jgi:hypothetical protein
MTKENKDIMTIVALLSIALLIIVFGPLAIIWSINTLFPVLAIPIGFYQWLAVVILNLTVFGKAIITRKD